MWVAILPGRILLALLATTLQLVVACFVGLRSFHLMISGDELRSQKQSIDLNRRGMYTPPRVLIAIERNTVCCELQ